MAINLAANIHHRILCTAATIVLLLCMHTAPAQSAGNTPDAENAASNSAAVPQENTGDSTLSDEETENRNYYYTATDDGYRVFQRIEWPAVQYILRYEVTLEYADNGGWTLYDEYETTENVLEVSLQAGTWRYAVSIINLFGKTVWKTEPREFIIKKAVIPTADDIAPTRIYLDEWHNGIITLRGNNFLPDTIFMLRKPGGRLYPLSADIDARGRRVELTFDEKQFDVGDWMLIAENPGKFTAALPFEIKFQKWYDFSVSLGYSPSFILADDTIYTYFGEKNVWKSLNARITFIPMKRRIGYFGIGIDANGMMLSGGSDGYDLAATFISGYLSGVYRKPLIKNRLTFEARAGAGVFAVTMLQFSFPPDLKTPAFTSYYLSVMGGCSFQLFAWRTLYVELGAFGTHTFVPDMMITTVNPLLTVGWQL